MNGVGTETHPLRVAVVGAGPAGFFLIDRLLGADLAVEVDLYDRLPAPYGLVRYGVAPDHEKIRNVTRTFDKIAARAGFRFFGNVDVGGDVTLDDLRRHYHQVCFTTGAQTDRRMGIPGEDLAGSHPATEFVAWYNAHPEFKDHTFDLARERVAVVGVGNVAVDVARILCRTPEELATTDIADYALDALRASRVHEVFMLGRRGPAQAAFTNAEVRELGELAAADIAVRPEEATPDALSQEDLARSEAKATHKKLEILDGFAHRAATGKPKRLTLRFLVSPVEIVGDGRGHVAGIRLVRNRLVRRDDGSLRAEPTDHLVARDDRSGTVPNERGRVVDPEANDAIPGVYVAGWIKRGPSGVIGTNKPDAAETAAVMIEDATAGATLAPEAADAAAAEATVRARAPAFVSLEDWRTVSALEAERGKPLGRPRVRFTSTAEVLDALGRAE
jgi:ferredoxin--NADP+ reductase